MLLTLQSPAICRNLASVQTVGIAVIGYGYWGPNLVRNFAKTEGIEVVAVSDLDPAIPAAADRLAAGIQQTTDFSDMITEFRIGAVAIATPVDTHHEIALAASRNGKHVLVEKPLAQTAAQAQHLIEEAERRGRVLMVD